MIIQNIYRKLFAQNYFYRFNKFLFTLSIKGMGIYNYENMTVSGEKNFIKTHIIKCAKKNIYIQFLM